MARKHNNPADPPPMPAKTRGLSVRPDRLSKKNIARRPAAAA
jgi:hypothetical protein